MGISCWNLLLSSKISSELSKLAGQPSVNQISRGVLIGRQSSDLRVHNDTRVNYRGCQRHQHQQAAYVWWFCKVGLDATDSCDKSYTPTDPAIRPFIESTHLPPDITCVMSSTYPRRIPGYSRHHLPKHAMQQSAAPRSENSHPCCKTNKTPASTCQTPHTPISHLFALNADRLAG